MICIALPGHDYVEALVVYYLRPQSHSRSSMAG